MSVAPTARNPRLRAPLLLALWALLAFEAGGGFVIFFARLASGHAPGLSWHWWAGQAFALVWAIYQLQHLARVWPVRARLDYALGLLNAASMILAIGSGYAVAWPWWVAGRPAAFAAFAPWWSGLHNVASMLVLTFTAAHVAAVLMRQRSAGGRRD